MKISNAWEYPDNFWMRSGYALVLRNGLLKPLPVNILKSSVVERIMHKRTKYLFNFGRVNIILDDWVSQDNKRPARSLDQSPFATENTQTFSNYTGAALNAGDDVYVNQVASNTKSIPFKHSGTVNQQTKSNNGFGINAIDVSLLSRKISL